MTRLSFFLILFTSSACSGSHLLFATDDAQTGPAPDGSVDAEPIGDAMPDTGIIGCVVGETCGYELGEFLKAPGARPQSNAGATLALSDDGRILAVGAPNDPSGASGTECDGIGPCAASVAQWAFRGSVQIWVRHDATWQRGTFVKAPESADRDFFGVEIALSGDGRTLAVGTLDESSPGVVHVYSGDSTGTFTFVESLRAPTGGAVDHFASSLALSFDGSVLAVGAWGEDSSTAGTSCNGEPGCVDDTLQNSGAVHVFERDGSWAYRAYLKASNPGEDDAFGTGLAVSHDGRRLVVGAPVEQSTTRGTECDGGACTNDDGIAVGALYVFERDATGWTQEAYLKPDFPLQGESLGQSLTMARDGSFIVASSPWVGAYAGTVTVFEETEDRWQQASQLGRAGLIGFGSGTVVTDDGSTL
ncbi:MAG: hypothetical protein AAGF12_31170, partial [Myxococcota bacterium]